MKYVSPVAELVALEAVSVVLASVVTTTEEVHDCPNEGEDF